MRISSLNRHSLRLQSRSVLLLTIAAAIAALAPISVHAQESFRFFELGASTGGMFHPSGASALGFEIGAGAGRNSVTAEGTRWFLKNYGLGVGSALLADMVVPTFGNAHPITQNAITGSVVDDINGNFQHDFFHSSKGATLFGAAGGGIAWVNFTENYLLGCPACVPTFVPQPLQGHRSATVPEFVFGGGVRVPLSKGFGVRLDLKSRWLGGVSTNYNFSGYLDNGQPFSGRHATGASISSNTLITGSITVYFRKVDRHL
jgi:hypothetical protein